MAGNAASETISYHCYIDHEEEEKYVLVDIATQNAKMKKIAVVSKALPYHKEIVHAFESELRGRGEKLSRVWGGGILKFKPGKKSIKTYGTSAGYGDPDRDMVEKVLRHCFPDWTIEVSVTEYIRG
jgi:hypothetical protein